MGNTNKRNESYREQEQLLHELLTQLPEQDYQHLTEITSDDSSSSILETTLLKRDPRWQQVWPLLLTYLRTQSTAKTFFESRRDIAWQSMQLRLPMVKVIKHTYRRQWVSWVAACILVLAGGCWWIYRHYAVTDAYQREYTYIKQWHTTDRAGSLIILPDSTHVWLNAHSHLAYIASHGETLRQVKLSGEGYFEVKSSKEAPFHVHTPQGTVMVTGTHFFVGAAPVNQQSYVELQEGHVDFRTYGLSSENFGIKPGQTLLIGSDDIIVTNSNSSVKDNSWLKKKIEAKAMPLHILIKQLETWYGVNIKLDKGLDAILFSGTIDPDQPLAVHFDKLRWTSNLHIVGKEGKYTIYSK